MIVDIPREADDMVKDNNEEILTSSRQNFAAYTDYESFFRHGATRRFLSFASMTR